MKKDSEKMTGFQVIVILWLIILTVFLARITNQFNYYLNNGELADGYEQYDGDW